MRKIVTYPHKALTKPTKPVTRLSKDVLRLLDEMHDVMVARDGIGLAANQLGVSQSIAIVELDEESGLFEMINPKIIRHSKKTEIDVEGCLSFPDTYGTVERYTDITVQYVDREGYEVEVDASGYLARVFQHEIEHLSGKIFTDRIIEPILPEDLSDDYMEGK